MDLGKRAGRGQGGEGGGKWGIECNIWQKNFKKKERKLKLVDGTGETAEWLNILVDLLNQDSVPSLHITAHNYMNPEF